jgi:alpha-methylacyl-CoA racemase
MSAAPSAAQPLAGLRVLDLSRLLPGPFATRVLADLGADVVKLEAPEGGDYLRWMPPLAPAAGPEGGDRASWAFRALNADKRGVALDLKHPEGAEAFRALVAQADVLIDSFRPGVLARLGFGRDVLEMLNPRLVHCAITGYGQHGPLALAPGHDLNYVARAGALALAGPPGVAPAVPPVQVADLSAALWAVVGVLAALEGRRHTGQGRFVDVDMTAGTSALLMASTAPWLNGAPAPRERGEDVLTGGQTCYRAYVCRDGRVYTLAALEPQFWAAFCARVERPEWLRRQFDPALGAEVAALFLSHDAAHWTALLSGTDACAEPALSLAEWRADPHTASLLLTGADGMVHLRTPARDPASPPPRPSPALGQHTREVLSALGWDLARIDALIAAGAARAPEVSP